MTYHRPVILLTGQPGIGKSTIVKKIAELITSKSGGFYTREVRKGKRRIGFEIVTLEGETDLLATKESSINFPQQVLFESYRINLDAIETVGIPALLKAMADNKIVVVDEIGPMEIFSAQFCDTILKILDDQTTAVVGTIVQRPYNFANEVKAHPRVTMKSVTLDNRDGLPSEIYSLLTK